VDEERGTELGGRRAFDEARDATRRTRLANERTYLAWWRTGLTALAVALGAGKLVPNLGGGGSTRGYELLGTGFALFGICCLGYGIRRQMAVEEALRSGQFAPPDSAIIYLLGLLGVVLGLGVVILILTG
jgi:putative membrane protein